MKELAESLHGVVLDSERRLLEFSDTHAGRMASPGVWTKKEVLGHLIDSASNNHQRFVRLQLADDLQLPRYEQEGWVRVQHYQSTKWPSLIELWRAYNLHLVRVIRDAAPETLAHTCHVGDGDRVTLQYLMEDYLVHMEHHMKELLQPL
jgi:hypothetical protein